MATFDLPQQRAGSTCSGPGNRLCKTRYNTTAPLYGVSLTSGQPVTIVQKFPDLLQQVIFEVCEWVYYLHGWSVINSSFDMCGSCVTLSQQLGRVWRRARWMRPNLRPLLVPGHSAGSGDADWTGLRSSWERLRLSPEICPPGWSARIHPFWGLTRYELKWISVALCFCVYRVACDNLRLQNLHPCWMFFSSERLTPSRQLLFYYLSILNVTTSRRTKEWDPV